MENPGTQKSRDFPLRRRILMQSNYRGQAQALRAFYIFTGLWSANFTQGLWILYLLHCHWSLLQVGIAEAAFHAVSFLSEVPTGMLADRYGRRLSLDLGLLVGTLSPLATFWLAPRSVLGGTLSIGFSALSWTFIGGADRALLYNLVENRQDQYQKAYGRIAALSLSTYALAVTVGGWMVGHIGWSGPFIGSALSSLLAFAATFGISTAMPPRTPERRPKLGETLSRTLGILKGNRRLLILVGFGALVGSLVTTNHLYAQATLMAKGASVFDVALVIAGGDLMSALGSLLGGRRFKVSLERWISVGTSLLGVLVGMIGVAPLGLSIVGYVAACGVDGAIDPAYEVMLNQEAPEDQRATILSMPSAGFSLGMVLMFPMFGWALANRDMAVAYAAMGASLMGLAILIKNIRHRDSPVNTTSAVEL